MQLPFGSVLAGGMCRMEEMEFLWRYSTPTRLCVVVCGKSLGTDSMCTNARPCLDVAPALSGRLDVVLKKLLKFYCCLVWVLRSCSPFV